jgi:hypothetical protein
MDDTVLVATSHDAMQRKFEILVDSAASLSMIIHPDKSKLLLVNSNDTSPLSYNNVSVDTTMSYVYLGTPISNLPIACQVKEHLLSKQRHVRKFSSFISRNQDAPFYVKYLTWSAAFSSALIYSCESWLTANLKCLELPLLRSLKELLGVRSQTCSDLVYLEIDQPTAKSTVMDRQLVFFKKMMKRPGYSASILKYVIDLAVQARSPMGKRLSYLQSARIDSFAQCDQVDRKRSVLQNASSSRRLDYVLINPGLVRHRVYDDSYIQEQSRIAFTRLRLSSHRLTFEMGRWSRTPRERRLCLCGATQTVEHVLIQCQLTQQLRQDFQSLTFSSVDELMQSNNTSDLCKFCLELLQLYTR